MIAQVHDELDRPAREDSLFPWQLSARDQPKRATRIPATMRAAALDRFGGPSVLRVHVLPVPDVGPSEARAPVRGARVLATASGQDGMAFVRRLGADAAADARRDDLRAAAIEFAPNGVDAVLALAPGKPLTQLLDSVRRGGRVAFPNGVEPAPRKRRGMSVQSYDATPGVREFERLGRAIEAAHLEVPIAASYPLDQAARAHERLAKSHVLGKILLRIRGR